MFDRFSILKTIRHCAPAVVISACAIIALGVPARADIIWNFTYSGGTFPSFGPHYDQPDYIAGQLATTNLNMASNTYTIIGITGTDNGSNIIGLQSEPYFDNLLYATAPYLDFDGFGFSDAAGESVNLYYKVSNGHYWDWFDQGATEVQNGNFIVTQATAAVPEPASIALLGVGLVLFAGIGLKRYRVRLQMAAASTAPDRAGRDRPCSAH